MDNTSLIVPHCFLGFFRVVIHDPQLQILKKTLKIDEISVIKTTKHHTFTSDNEVHEYFLLPIALGCNFQVKQLKSAKNNNCGKMEAILCHNIKLPAAMSVLFCEIKQLNVVGYAMQKQKTKRVNIQNYAAIYLYLF